LKPGSPRVSWRTRSDQRNQRLIPIAIGRLHAGINLAQAQEKLDALAASLRLEYASDYPRKPVGPLESTLAGVPVGNVRPMLMVLMAAVVVILLIGP